ncbi:ABC transporter substrate-binding protein [Roseiarcaceae bacterium H3SJ34-1]|uniref:ABC transporter substrate-binding protein n=1 Tax=Terripilifer ovatus TaxID=3032367 RepID=UPI003AB924A2|nr:ABC transporter substrate-binding protein [Roseiarcaceae bacterium H3SJ34-1]
MPIFNRLALAAMLSAIVATAVPALAQDKIVIGDVGSGSSTHWPLYIAIEKGWAAEAKVSFETISIPSSAAVMQQLAAGAVNVGTTGLADALRGADKGAPARVLRIEIGPSPYEVLSAPTVKTWADLRGKTVMIGGVKDITRIYFEDMAKANGLKPGEYDYIYAGATAARFAALASGSIAATILAPPFNFKALGAGYNSLGTSATYTKDVPFTGYTVNVNWAQKNKSAIRKMMDLYARGIDWFYDSKNKDEAVAILVKSIKTDPKDTADTYDFFVKLKVFDRDGDVEKSGIEHLIKILKDQGEIEGSTDISRFYDASLTK